MWLCTNRGFFSVVEKPTGTMQIRARRRQELQALIDLTGIDSEIITGAGTDYRYRIMVDRPTWLMVAQTLAADIDYSNFKSSVKDDDLHDAYLSFWSTMYSYQQREPSD